MADDAYGGDDVRMPDPFVAEIALAEAVSTTNDGRDWERARELAKEHAYHPALEWH